MKVNIKNFNLDMEIKNKGIELDICDNNGKHIGDLVVTKTKLVWCKGKTDPKNGIPRSWAKFIEYMENN